jgi:hypothetical protein
MTSRFFIECGLCRSLIYPNEEESHSSQFGKVCVLCFRALEIHGKVF